MSRRAVTVVIGLVLLGSGAVARAGEGDALYKRGVELRRAGKDAEALEVFRKLADHEKSPRSAAQMGLAEQALGMWVEAEGHIQGALGVDGDAWIVKNHAALVRALDEIGARLGNIDVWGEPAGAEVVIDGKVVGTLPLAKPVRAVVGSVPIVVRSPGYLERSTVVMVSAGQSARERFVLQRAEPPATSGAPALASNNATNAGAAVAAVAVVAPADIPVERPGTLRRSSKWIAWGIGAAALGVGIYGTVGQNSAGDDFDRSCALDAAGVPQARAGSGKTAADCAGLRSNVDSAFRVEVIGLAGAAVLGAAGLVLWLTEPDGHEGTKSAGLACAPSLLAGRSPGMGCSWRF